MTESADTATYSNTPAVASRIASASSPYTRYRSGISPLCPNRSTPSARTRWPRTPPSHDSVAGGPSITVTRAASAASIPSSRSAWLPCPTSSDRDQPRWRRSLEVGQGSHAERLLGMLAADAALVTVIDGPPATLSWLGGVRGHRVRALGVDRFGQSGDIPDLYRV